MGKIFAFLQAHRWLRDGLLGTIFVILTVSAISYVYQHLYHSELGLRVSFAIATILITGATLFFSFLVVMFSLFVRKPKAKAAIMPSKPIANETTQTVAVKTASSKPKKKEPKEKPARKKAAPPKKKLAEVKAETKEISDRPAAVRDDSKSALPRPQSNGEKKTITRKATKIEVKKSNSAPIVRLYIDFDGTLTYKPGEQLVTHPVYDKLTLMEGYRTMLENPGAVSISSISRNLKELDEGEISYISMSKEAIDFLNDLLKQSNDIDINIISKNHAAYIKAIMQFHHLNPEQFSIQGISELTGLKDKGEALQKVEKLKKNPAEHLFIFDDNDKDAIALLQGALSAGYDEENIHLHKRQPGCFEWEEYRKDVLEKIAHSKSQKEEKE